MKEIKSEVVVDKTDLKLLQEKYKSVNPNQIQDYIIQKCKYYSYMPQEVLEKKFGFECGKKREFIEGIKDFITLVQNDYKAAEKFFPKLTREEYLASKRELFGGGTPIKKVEPEKTLELDSSILKQIKKIISKYVDTNVHNIDILSLWLLGTYFHSEFETYPLLQLNAQKRSGKTRTLKLLSSLAYKSDGSVSTSATETHLFRHKEGAMFFDEMESISSKEKTAFRETLNAVYKRGNKIIRYKEKNKEYVEEAFFPYYPLALANIHGLNDVLADRAVQVILRRSSHKKITKLVEDFTTNKEMRNLKEKLSTLKAKIPKNFFEKWNKYVQGEKFKDKELIILFNKINETQIYGRSLELFFPLFIIAYLCKEEDDFLKKAKEYVQLKEEEEAVDDFDERLKDFVSKKVLELSGYVNISTILEGFRATIEKPEEWVNSKWLGRALKRLDLVKGKRNVNGRVQVIINSTNSSNTILSTNSTNPTNKGKKVGYVESVGLIGEAELEKNPTKEEFPVIKMKGGTQNYGKTKERKATREL